MRLKKSGSKFMHSSRAKPRRSRAKSQQPRRKLRPSRALAKAASKHFALQEEAAPYLTATTVPFRFLEFFAGGGMARAGLQPQWQSVWANDFSAAKASVYQKNWGLGELYVGDVAKVDADSLPEAHMVWGSFPCQDLSAAGNRSGIGRENDSQLTRSGSFWPFWKLVERHFPPIVVLENVEGALKANDGADFRALCSALCRAGYRYGPMILDAVHWLPQSRKRLFIVAVNEHMSIPRHLLAAGPDPFCHSPAIDQANCRLDETTRARWLWWALSPPAYRRSRVESLISTDADCWVQWDTPEKTRYILSLMNDRHTRKIEQAKQMNQRVVGFAYRRTRYGKQQAEVRFDGIAGCLRTAGGGSSKQIVVEVNGERVRTRLLSPREAARLQGLPDTYWLPEDYNEAYDLVGDGLSVPVVRFLGEQLLTPLASVIPKHQLATA
jgi:DNA (cytosine-5)-methyltransferase 1